MSGPVDLTSGPAETVLEPIPDTVARRLEAARSAPIEHRREALADVVRAFPAVPDGWAELAELARDDLEAYAYYRVGYHRGLDALRRSGWRGTGLVRWDRPSNRGFLRCLDGLRGAAGAIGEGGEEERCALFLKQLDPSWPPPTRGDAP
ncbi:MAG TPA: DUF3151 family protein [Acidimicrobiales bacterium]|nr:DUF3151 family protein [Acidimicrobiales bacterium]